MQIWVIILRLFHVGASVFWVGGLTLLTFFLLPAFAATAGAGTAVLNHLLGRTKLIAFLPTVGVLTVLSGFLLYWHDNMSSPGTFAKSAAGMAFGTGGAAGLAALIVGSIMASGSAAAIVRINAEIEASSGVASPDQTARLAALRVRLKKGAHIAWGLMVIALAAMAVARYL